MASLKSIDTIPGIDIREYRSTIYWNKFKYRARLKIQGAQYLYNNPTIEQWKKMIAAGGSNWQGCMNPKEIVDTLEKADAIAAFIEFRKNHKKDKTLSIRVENKYISIFSNDIAVLHSIEDWAGDSVVDYTEAIACGYAGVKYFKRTPKHKYRIYFKSMKVSINLATELNELITKHKGLYPSHSMKRWLIGGRTWMKQWISQSYHLDYDDESTLSYLMLMHGDVLGKKFKLETHPLAV